MSQPKDPTAADRKRRQRENDKRSGLVQINVTVPAGKAAELREIARKMREDCQG